MSAKPVSPVNGKYTIPGKRDIELTIDGDDSQYIVETLAGSDMTDKLPSSNPDNIDWFACFSVYNKQNGKKGGYANVQYFFSLPLQSDQRLFIGYKAGTQDIVRDVTQEFRNSGKVTMHDGDPAVGTIPPFGT